MSASGHLQTFGESKRMSALPPESGYQMSLSACLLGVKTKITRAEHNESALALAADIGADVYKVCVGPTTDF